MRPLRLPLTASHCPEGQTFGSRLPSIAQPAPRAGQHAVTSCATPAAQYSASHLQKPWLIIFSGNSNRPWNCVLPLCSPSVVVVTQHSIRRSHLHGLAAVMALRTGGLNRVASQLVENAENCRKWPSRNAEQDFRNGIHTAAQLWSHLAGTPPLHTVPGPQHTAVTVSAMSTSCCSQDRSPVPINPLTAHVSPSQPNGHLQPIVPRPRSMHWPLTHRESCAHEAVRVFRGGGGGGGGGPHQYCNAKPSPPT